MSALRLAGLIVAAHMFGCAPSEIGPPDTTTVMLSAVGTTTLSIDRLRVAGLYRNRDAVETTADVAVTATGTLVLGTLTAPTIDLSATRNRRIAVTLGGGLFGRDVQFFAYLDADGSGGFSNGPDLTGPDRVVAAAFSGQTYAWIPDIAMQLANQSPEFVNAYYSATNNQFAEFLPIAPANDFDANVTTPFEISLFLGGFDLARHRLFCSQSLSGDTIANVQVRVDPSAGGDTLCALEIPDCTTATVADLDAPEHPLDNQGNIALRTAAQCRRSERLEAIVFEEERLKCSVTTCACDLVSTVDAIVTSTGALPSWWPCGDTIDICDSPLPLYRVDRTCLD